MGRLILLGVYGGFVVGVVVSVGDSYVQVSSVVSVS